MNIDLYERIWMWGVAVVLALFFTSTAVAAFSHGIHPPSHIETIDPTKVLGRDSLVGLAAPDPVRKSRLQALLIPGLRFLGVSATIHLPESIL